MITVYVSLNHLEFVGGVLDGQSRYDVQALRAARAALKRAAKSGHASCAAPTSIRKLSGAALCEDVVIWPGRR